MRISRVEAHLLSYPLPEPQGDVAKRDAMLIRVETDLGLVGYAPGPGSERTQKQILEVVKPFLEGRVLRDPDALRVHFIEAAGKQHINAYCAVEIALYDLAGKAKQLPVSELLGGRVREHIRLYGSAGLHQKPEQCAEEALAIAELGFRAYKMRADLETVRQVRQAAGSDFDLMVDGQTWWHRTDIEKLAEALAEHNIAWLEEPLPPADHQAYRRLKDRDLVPLATGRYEPDELRYMELILTGSVDYVQMNIASQGGYPTATRLLSEIVHADLKFAFQNNGTALDAIVAAQFAVCWPEATAEWLEYPCYSAPTRAGMYPFPLAAEILCEPLEIDNGDLVVPRGPGLGVEVDESVIQRYPYIAGHENRS